MLKLLIGSKNIDKIIEIKEILKELNLEIVSAADFPNLSDVEEDKDSIEGNAELKAITYAKKTGLLTLADDTGLFVDALNGKPGVYSARYAGENCSYKDNRDKLLNEMKGKTNRNARFKTAVCLADKSGLIASVFGKVEGKITEYEIGDNGFGYDSIFFVDETKKTFGEMEDLEKHLISHRGRAFTNILPILKDIINKKNKRGIL
jgi:XTP/dITP diphosphohydrolase